MDNMDVEEVIESLKKFENSKFEVSFKEVCAFDITIQVLERYMKEWEKKKRGI